MARRLATLPPIAHLRRTAAITVAALSLAAPGTAHALTLATPPSAPAGQPSAAMPPSCGISGECDPPCITRLADLDHYGGRAYLALDAIDHPFRHTATASLDHYRAGTHSAPGWAWWHGWRHVRVHDDTYRVAGGNSRGWSRLRLRHRTLWVRTSRIAVFLPCQQPAPGGEELAATQWWGAETPRDVFAGQPNDDGTIWSDVLASGEFRAGHDTPVVHLAAVVHPAQATGGLQAADVECGIKLIHLYGDVANDEGVAYGEPVPTTDGDLSITRSIHLTAGSSGTIELEGDFVPDTLDWYGAMLDCVVTSPVPQPAIMNAMGDPTGVTATAGLEASPAGGAVTPPSGIIVHSPDDVHGTAPDPSLIPVLHAG